RLVADPELQDLFAQMKARLGDPGMSYQELLKSALKKALGIRTTRASSPATTSPGEVKPRRPTIPAMVRREIRTQAGNQCTYVAPLNGRRCEARHGLQIEHRIPWAMGGSSDLANLTLLCASHNQLRAIEIYGEKKIGRYRRSASEGSS